MKFVLADANDWNFDKGNEGNLNSILDQISDRCAITQADKLIVQDSDQRELVVNNFRRESTVFYNVFLKQNREKKVTIFYGWVELSRTKDRIC
jgi:hypothetical protein